MKITKEINRRTLTARLHGCEVDAGPEASSDNYFLLGSSVQVEKLTKGESGPRNVYRQITC